MRPNIIFYEVELEFLFNKVYLYSTQLISFFAQVNTVKLDDKERFDKEKIGVKEPFPVTI